MVTLGALQRDARWTHSHFRRAGRYSLRHSRRTAHSEQRNRDWKATQGNSNGRKRQALMLTPSIGVPLLTLGLGASARSPRLNFATTKAKSARRARRALAAKSATSLETARTRTESQLPRQCASCTNGAAADRKQVGHPGRCRLPERADSTSQRAPPLARQRH